MIDAIVRLDESEFLVLVLQLTRIRLMKQLDSIYQLIQSLDFQISLVSNDKTRTILKKSSLTFL